MDTLVAHYSRPVYQQEAYSWEEQQELSGSMPPLSLRFALPSMPNVFSALFPALVTFLKPVLMDESSLPPFFAQQQMIMQIRTVPSSSHTAPLHSPFAFKGVLLSLPTQEQQLGTGLLVRPSRRLLKSITVY